MLENFLGKTEIGSANNEHAFHLAVAEDRHVAHHLVIDELVGAARTQCAVDEHQAAEMCVIDQQGLASAVAGAIHDAVGFIGDPHSRCDVLLERANRLGEAFICSWARICISAPERRSVRHLKVEGDVKARLRRVRWCGRGLVR
jgi:hypothetical protein